MIFGLAVVVPMEQDKKKANFKIKKYRIFKDIVDFEVIVILLL